MLYLALLRGINVGGSSLIKMDALKTALEACGLTNVKTFIQSGNVFFDSPKTSDETTPVITKCLKDEFKIDAGVVVFTQDQWHKIISDAPKWWGTRLDKKHNLLIVIKPTTAKEVLADAGQLKPDIEVMEAGDGVLYQSMSLELFGRTTTGKLASSPLYKQLTIRNYNTATKLLGLF